MKKLTFNRQKGFTIIEVMIVLAIAGVIIAAVLIAVPQLQRNQRNSARRAVVSRMKTEIDNYVSNNNGTPPADAADITSLKGRYLSNINIDDPSTGVAMDLTYTTDTLVDGDPFPGTGVGNVEYYASKICKGEDVENGTARQYAVWAELQGGAIFCMDNR